MFGDSQVLLGGRCRNMGGCKTCHALGEARGGQLSAGRPQEIHREGRWGAGGEALSDNSTAHRRRRLGSGRGSVSPERSCASGGHAALRRRRAGAARCQQRIRGPSLAQSFLAQSQQGMRGPSLALFINFLSRASSAPYERCLFLPRLVSTALGDPNPHHATHDKSATASATTAPIQGWAGGHPSGAPT